VTGQFYTLQFLTVLLLRRKTGKLKKARNISEKQTVREPILIILFEIGYRTNHPCAAILPCYDPVICLSPFCKRPPMPSLLVTAAVDLERGATLFFALAIHAFLEQFNFFDGISAFGQIISIYYQRAKLRDISRNKRDFQFSEGGSDNYPNYCCGVRKPGSIIQRTTQYSNELP